MAPRGYDDCQALRRNPAHPRSAQVHRVPVHTVGLGRPGGRIQLVGDAPPVVSNYMAGRYDNGETAG